MGTRAKMEGDPTKHSKKKKMQEPDPYRELIPNLGKTQIQEDPKAALPHLYPKNS